VSEVGDGGAAARAPARRGPIVRAIRNAGWLLGGKGVGGLFSLVYLSLAARSLGVERFGEFALVLSYGQVLTHIVQFQSWQTVIRYGARHLAEARADRLQRVLVFATLLGLGASLAGAVLAGAGVLLVGAMLDWTGEERRMAALFGLALVFGLRGAPTGILRLLDRFDLAAFAETVLPTVRLIGAVIVWWLGASVGGLLLVWAAAELAASLRCGSRPGTSCAGAVCRPERRSRRTGSWARTRACGISPGRRNSARRSVPSGAGCWCLVSAGSRVRLPPAVTASRYSSPGRWRSRSCHWRARSTLSSRGSPCTATRPWRRCCAARC